VLTFWNPAPGDGVVEGVKSQKSGDGELKAVGKQHDGARPWVGLAFVGVWLAAHVIVLLIHLHALTPMVLYPLSLGALRSPSVLGVVSGLVIAVLVGGALLHLRERRTPASPSAAGSARDRAVVGLPLARPHASDPGTLLGSPGSL
jgi:hypothetical protein